MRNAMWHLILIAIVIGILVVGTQVGVDWLLHSGWRQVHASDLFVGAVAALASGAAMHTSNRRRQDLMLRMQAIKDVNHHVRNALTAVTFSTALKNDPELTAVVQEANARIDWVLREVLPHSAEASVDGVRLSKWGRGTKEKAAER